MTLSQLRQFAVLAGAGSFVKASALLHMTQPALSRSIKALEEELGRLLFDRVGRRIELTAFGRETLTRSQALLEAAAQLRRSGKALTAEDSGHVRLGLSSGPGAMLSVPVMRHFASRFPNFQVDLVRANTEALTRMLRERQVDALVVDVRSLRPSADLRVEQTTEMRGVFMCRKEHPLARKRKVSFADLSAYPVASTPLSDELARILVERYGERAHPQAMVRFVTDEIAHLVALTLQSDVVLLAIRAAAPMLAEVRIDPPLAANARFGLVTVANRAEAIYLPEIRRLMASELC